MLHLSFFEAFLGISQHAAATAISALWQGGLIAAGLYLCARATTRISAAHRFLLWGCGFAALVCLPLLPLLAHFFAITSSGDSTGLRPVQSEGWLQLNIRWAIAITLVWIIASSLRTADLLIHSIRLLHLWRDAKPIEDTSLPMDLSTHCGHRSFDLCRTSRLDRPCVIGFFRPRILIPDWLVDRLTPSELEQIVLHEAEHLRRRDDWSNLLQKLCLILFPLNPALAWIERRLCHEREMACDEAVIRATQAPRAYAACLASLAERGLRHRAEALSLGAWQRRAELVNRVHRILGRPRIMSPLAARTILGTLACGLVLVSFELARSPQFVAFIPDQQQQLAQQRVEPIDPMARAVNASYTSGLGPAPSRFHVVNAVAHTPDRPSHSHTKSGKGSARVHNPAAVPILAKIAEPSIALTTDTEKNPRPVRSASPQQDQPQEWLVLTTWEQVVTTAPRAVSDADTVEDSASNREQKSQPSLSTTRQITVTRLILRVAPASSAPSQPSAMPVVRDSWFVFQL